MASVLGMLEERETAAGLPAVRGGSLRPPLTTSPLYRA